MSTPNQRLKETAKPILGLGFSDDHQSRMHYLAARNSEGKITPEERVELDHFVELGDRIAILHAKARIILRDNRES